MKCPNCKNEMEGINGNFTCNYCHTFMENIKTSANIIIPIKGFLFVEDGSVDVDSLEENIQGSGIEIVIYRQGAPMPKLVLIDKEEE